MTYNNCGSSSNSNNNNNNSSSTKTYLSSSARQRQQTSSNNGNNTKSIRNSSYLRVCHFCCAVFATVFFCLLPPNHSFTRASAPTLSLSLSFALCGGFGAPRWVKISKNGNESVHTHTHSHLQVCSVCHPANMFLTSKFNYLLFSQLHP